ncbi:tRNA threonylcarbamoyladenosine dehydratase [Treponema pectinovorum]|uniref:tRNA threonylcarbamoyladenosine dehydratase n=1 Tax=Treponema pectinovorum TaxID=164 RepID=UPI003D8CC101
MNEELFERTQLIFGKEKMQKLSHACVIVFGIGGVGSYVVEALARAGIGFLDIVDDDKVCFSNINRQIYALHSTVGKNKVDVAEQRILDINPDCKVVKHKVFFLPETSAQFDFSCYDYVVDCIDTVKGKIEIIQKAQSAEVPVISCMGAGNKIEPSLLKIADIYDTSVCPLARVMRAGLKKRGIQKLKCLYSTETPIRHQETGKRIPGSNSFVPPVAGLLIASEVIKDLAGF